MASGCMNRATPGVLRKRRGPMDYVRLPARCAHLSAVVPTLIPSGTAPLGSGSRYTMGPRSARAFPQEARWQRRVRSHPRSGREAWH
jgi:hypothetical protein